jgi:hypothetical protein
MDGATAQLGDPVQPGPLLFGRHYFFGLDDLKYDANTKAVAVPIEVPAERRAQPNALADYESDVWKIYGNMVAAGFGDLYYEALDWKEEGNP